MAPNLRLTQKAAAELCRQASTAGTPGEMHLDLLPGECADYVIRIRPGNLAGNPIARSDGITLHAPTSQISMLSGLFLDYRDDLTGGGFIIKSLPGIQTCPCGSSFSRLQT